MAKKPKAPPPSDAKIYRKTFIELWHDLQFKKLSVNAQHTYLLLCTGPQTESLPLLQLASPGILETHCPALGYDNIKAGLAELRASGFCDFADDQPVIALPKYAAEERCNSYKVLTSWLKVYTRIPDGIIKRKYTATLRSLVDFSANSDVKDEKGKGYNPLTKTWNDHFGDTLSDTLSDTSDQGSGIRDAVISNQGTAYSECVPDSGESGAHTPMYGIDPEDEAREEAPSEADLLDAYKNYPRKEGKKKGLEICRAKIKTKEQYWHLYWGILQYAYEVQESDKGSVGSSWAKQTPKCFDRYMSEGAWEEAAERFAGSARGKIDKSDLFLNDQYSFEPGNRLAHVFDRINELRAGIFNDDPLDDNWRNHFFIAVRLDQGRSAQALMKILEMGAADAHLDMFESPPLWDLPVRYVEEANKWDAERIKAAKEYWAALSRGEKPERPEGM